MARPRKYSRTLATKVCRLLSDGIPLTKICKMEGFPTYPTVLSWLWEDHDDKDWFFSMYARARDMQADKMVDEIISISDDATKDDVMTEEGFIKTDHENIQRSRLRVEARKWVAAKLKPRKYGDKLELSGDKDNPLTVNIVQFSGKTASQDDPGSTNEGKPV